MSDEVRETEVRRDPEGRITGYIERTEERYPKRGGGFGWGFLLGVLIIALGVIYFAFDRGSFEGAGAEADRATARAETQTREAASDAERSIGQAAESTGESLQKAGERAQQAAPKSPERVEK